jgi:hypothetical protein
MERKYTLERSLLQRGDIILTAERAPLSKGVRFATGSKYSHAALWVGGTMIEAVMPGVFSKNAQRLILDKPTHCAVFRSRAPLSEEQLDVICRYARSQVGTLYALDEAMLVLPRRLMKLETTKRQFCSRLAALAYAEIDYDFINLRSPQYCTPRQLARCKAFREVKGLVRPAEPGELEIAERVDPNIKNAADTFEWLGKVRALVESDSKLRQYFDIQSVLDVNNLLLAHPELDGPIVSFLHENDYLTFFNHDAQANPHRYDPDALAAMLRASSSRQDFLKQEFGKESSLIRLHVENVRVSIINYAGTGLIFVLEHLRLYRNLLNEIWIRLNNLVTACETVGVHIQLSATRDIINFVRVWIDLADRVLIE